MLQRPQHPIQFRYRLLLHLRASNAGFGAERDFIRCGGMVVRKCQLRIGSVIDNGRLFSCTGTVIFFRVPVWAVGLYRGLDFILPVCLCCGFFTYCRAPVTDVVCAFIVGKEHPHEACPSGHFQAFGWRATWIWSYHVLDQKIGMWNLISFSDVFLVYRFWDFWPWLESGELMSLHAWTRKNLTSSLRLLEETSQVFLVWPRSSRYDLVENAGNFYFLRTFKETTTGACLVNSFLYLLWRTGYDVLQDMIRSAVLDSLSWPMRKCIKIIPSPADGDFTRCNCCTYYLLLLLVKPVKVPKCCTSYWC